MTYKELSENYNELFCLFKNLEHEFEMIDAFEEDAAIERYELLHSPLVFPEDVDLEMAEYNKKNEVKKEKASNLASEISNILGDNEELFELYERIMSCEVYPELAIRQIGNEPYAVEEIHPTVLNELVNLCDQASLLDSRYYPNDRDDISCREELPLPEKIPEIEAIKYTVLKSAGYYTGIIALSSEQSNNRNVDDFTRLGQEVLKEIFPNNTSGIIMDADTDKIHMHFWINPTDQKGNKIFFNQNLVNEMQSCINRLADKYGFNAGNEHSITFKITQHLNNMIMNRRNENTNISAIKKHKGR